MKTTEDLPLPCWCDWRCGHEPTDCTCLFHRENEAYGSYDCGSPKTRDDILRVAEELFARGQGVDYADPIQLTLNALDWLDKRGYLT